MADPFVALRAFQFAELNEEKQKKAQERERLTERLNREIAEIESMTR